jgi:hypothetical protein
MFMYQCISIWNPCPCVVPSKTIRASRMSRHAHVARLPPTPAPLASQSHHSRHNYPSITRYSIENETSIVYSQRFARARSSFSSSMSSLEKSIDFRGTSPLSLAISSQHVDQLGVQPLFCYHGLSRHSLGTCFWTVFKTTGR